MIGIGGTTAADALKLRNIPIIRNENWCTTGHIALLEACAMVAVCVAVTTQTIADIGYTFLNPRIRFK